MLQNRKSSSVAVILKICLFEIQGEILCLIHFRDSFVWNRKANYVPAREVLNLYSAFSDYKVKLFKQKIVFYEFWLAKRNFLAMSLLLLSGNVTITGLDKYNNSK